MAEVSSFDPSDVRRSEPQWPAAAEVPPAGFVNIINLAPTQEGIYMTLGQLAPAPMPSPDGQEIGATGRFPVSVAGRFILTAPNAKELVKLLQVVIKQHEELAQLSAGQQAQ